MLHTTPQARPRVSIHRVTISHETLFMGRVDGAASHLQVGIPKAFYLFKHGSNADVIETACLGAVAQRGHQTDTGKAAFIGSVGIANYEGSRAKIVRKRCIRLDAIDRLQHSTTLVKVGLGAHPAVQVWRERRRLRGRKLLDRQRVVSNDASSSGHVRFPVLLVYAGEHLPVGGQSTSDHRNR